jgi:hypothetical protein
MKVRKLTEEQKSILVGKKWNEETYFNPVLDANGNWFITEGEFYGLTLIKAIELGVENWYPNLEQIDYNPIILNLPI